MLKKTTTTNVRNCLGLLFLCVAFFAKAIIVNAQPSDTESEVFESLYVRERIIVDVHVNADATNVTTQERVTLIKDQSMVDALSSEDLLYNSSQEEVEVLEAYTILPSGQRVQVNKEAIRTVDADASSTAAGFSDSKKRVIIYPKVSAGARTYLKTRTTTHTPILPKTFYLYETFMPRTEYGFVEINLSHDPKIQIYVDARDLPGGKIDDALNGDVRFRYTFSQSQIEKAEPNQVDPIDFVPFVLFSSVSSAIALGDIIEQLAAPQYAVTPKVQALAEQITQGVVDLKDQAKALYNWVNKNIRYEAIFVGNGGLIPHDADSIIDNHYGDCKDHNALLISLLAAKGIFASSAFVNLGSAFSVPRLGTISPFNHVITYIPQWDLYLDSTQEMAPFGILLTAVRDKPTVLTALHRMGRTSNLSADENQQITDAKLFVGQDGTVTGAATTKYFGNQDAAARFRFSEYSGQARDSIVRAHLWQFREIGKGSYQPSNVYDLDTSMIVNSRFELLPVSNFPGPGAMTVPIGLTPGDLTMRGYYAPRREVHRPFTCTSLMIEENYEIIFHDTIKVTRIPQDVSYVDARLSYVASYEKSGQKIVVRRAFRSQQPGRVCQPKALLSQQAFHQVNRKDILSQIFYE